MSRLLVHTAAHFLIPIILFIAGCADDGSRSVPAVCCDNSAEPIFLRSKADDEDGDGNIFDEDFPAIDDEDDDIMDHTWIRDSYGVYHLFFMTEDHGDGSFIEHYRWATPESLDYVGPALYPDPQGWDSHGLWAPHVIRHGDTYYMFYTGVDGTGGNPTTTQRIGLATSKDLMTWTRYPVNNCPGTSGEGCIYECDECWTTWGNPPGSYDKQCRDPFVIWDSDNNRWVMFATAKSLNQYGEVTVAYSGDLINWTGAGYIDATRRLEDGEGAQTTGGQAENPFVATHDGMHYLLFTDWQDPEDTLTVIDPRTQVQYAISQDLTADTLGSANWVYRGYIPDPGVNAIEVLELGRLSVMSQSISNEKSGYWHIRRHLRLKCVIWGGDLTFDTSNLSLGCSEAPSSVSPMAVSPRTP